MEDLERYLDEIVNQLSMISHETQPQCGMHFSPCRNLSRR